MVELMYEKWQGSINTVQIGATEKEGGSRCHSIQVGGAKTLPFLFSEGELPHKPVIAFEIWDTVPRDWPEPLQGCFSGVWNEPLAWAELCVEKFGAKLLCVRLQAAHPEFENKSPEQEQAFISKLLKRVGVPLIIIGCGDDAKDNEVLPAVSEAAKNERCLLGSAVHDNYRTIVASAIAYGQSIIAESPIDVNIAKQLNMLIMDVGLPLERIVIDPTIGALGYGLEYAYSIMERARLAALAGDRTLACPFLCFVGQESWRAKEAKATEEEFPDWGNSIKRGILWEAGTAVALLQAGADILVMRHPEAIKAISEHIEQLYQKGAK